VAGRGARVALGSGFARGDRERIAAARSALWYDEAYEHAILTTIATMRGLTTVRNVARSATRTLLSSPWSDVRGPLESLRGHDPRSAFADFPRVWALVRRDAGELRCLEARPREALTELRSLQYATSPAWCEAWLGAHEGLLRQLHHAGHAEREVLAGAPFILRVRTRWAGALSGVPTGGHRVLQ
jgi:hypothetical protein